MNGTTGGGWGAYAGDPAGASAHYAKWPYDRIIPTASAIEARRAETAQTGSVADESAGPKDDAPPQSEASE